ncbi:MAG: hypothetical protein J0L94_01925, partial [Rhodothermia bacterium]|nr:hypothetical protein [Rhodothermia bacterium]
CHIFWLAINPNTLARGFLHRPPLSALVMTNRDLPHQSNIVIEIHFRTRAKEYAKETKQI